MSTRTESHHPSRGFTAVSHGTCAAPEEWRQYLANKKEDLGAGMFEAFFRPQAVAAPSLPYLLDGEVFLQCVLHSWRCAAAPAARIEALRLRRGTHRCVQA